MSKVTRFLITESKEIDKQAVSLLISAGYEVIDNAQGQNYSVDGLFIRSYTKVDKTYLDQFRRLKVILRAGVGLDNVDLEECSRRDIKVFNSPGANSEAVAEYVLTMSLYMLRKIGVQMKQVSSGNWRDVSQAGESIQSKVFGLIGCGHAGKALSKILSSMGVTCLGYDPYVSADDLDKQGIRKRSLPELLRESDVIVVMLPLTTETKNLLGVDNLELIKQGSIIINVSRGEIIDEESLAKLVADGHIGGAVLDVVQGEPNINPKLLNIDSLIITPHIAGFTIQSNKQIAVQAVEHFIKSVTL